MLARFPSRFGVIAVSRFTCANGRLGSIGEKPCELAELTARAWCVLSVDVKDPTRLLPTQQRSPYANLIKGVPKPNGEAIRRTTDRGTGLHPDLLSTSTIPARFSALHGAVASPWQTVRAVS